MFKLGSFEEEIYQSMEQNIIASQTEKEYGFSKLAQAIDLLNDAANIFEQVGMQEEADDVSSILTQLSKEIGA